MGESSKKSGSDHSIDNTPSTALPPEKSGFITSDLPELDEEWIQHAEEVALSNVATDMVRLHKRLMQLHYGQDKRETRKRSRQKNKKRDLSIPSSIDAAGLESRLKHVLEDEHIFLRDELTLANLAHEIGIEPHHLSRFLNIHLHTTFHDLVNSYRVNETKAMLVNNPDTSILEIAFATGFNSKASFNRIFKKMTGSTPKQFRSKTINAGPGRSQF
jgi:transcriptional regulator GlxA family with amidase domain